MKSESSAILRIDDVSHEFGGVAALAGCSWSMERGTITALIGPNGAGKSTLINVVAGSLEVQKGRVHFDGTDITGWAAFRVASHGLVRTFQVARAFNRLTVLENMLVACQQQPGESLFNAVLRPRFARRAEQKQIARALELLHFLELYPLRNDYASDLSGGQKRLLELGRSLMADPTLLILDEPMAAINPAMIERISAHLQEIRSWGISLMMVEHNLAVVEDICDSVTVMAEGKVLSSGSMAELRADRSVVDAYLGV